MTYPSFGGHHANKIDLIKQVVALTRADRIARGTTGTPSSPVGATCIVTATVGQYHHGKYAMKVGTPLWFPFLVEALFETSTYEGARTMPLRVLLALPVGVPEAAFTQLHLDLYAWVEAQPQINRAVAANAESSFKADTYAPADIVRAFGLFRYYDGGALFGPDGYLFSSLYTDSGHAVLVNRFLSMLEDLPVEPGHQQVEPSELRALGVDELLGLPDFTRRAA
ncbi:MAG: hypothetical protein GC129_06105 [Proteobacteria bacterium]|nr:hypothetical protein [Pseudomonadota bacterium]